MNGRPPEIPPHKLIRALRGYDLLPAIVFLPTRRKCDESASEVAADKSQKNDEGKFILRKKMFEEFVAENPEIRRHKHSKILVNAGVASHHAGHIPAWKLLIEKMMSAGLLNAIFATSTVAAGVDFPARTVVISNADTRGDQGWRPLTVNEIQQMTGRAGRRGKDNVGFAVLAPGQFQNPKRIAELLKSSPEPIESKFRATYTSLLNLLDAFGSFGQVREIAEKSFAFRHTGRKIEKLRSRIASLENDLKKRLETASLHLTLRDLRGFERLASARERLESRIPLDRTEFRRQWLLETIKPGRVVTQGRSAKRLFIVLAVRGDVVSAMRDDGQGRTISLSHINRVYEKIYRLEESEMERAFIDVFEGRNAVIDEPKFSLMKNVESGSDILNDLLEKIISPETLVLTDEARLRTEVLLWESIAETSSIRQNEMQIEMLQDEIWLPFESHARVLDHFGYIDFFAEKVTETGKWLADVRVDRPLLVGEALRHGIFEKVEPQVAAGLMAAIAADPERSYGDLYLSDALMEPVADFEELVYDVSSVEWKYGVTPAEQINLSAAAAAEQWASGGSWGDLVKKTKAEEGDLVRLMSRTGEALLQIAALTGSNPHAAAIASESSEAVLREPVR